MPVGIETIAAYVPEKVISRDAFSYLADVLPDFDTAPLQRRRCEREDAVPFMCIEVANKVLAAGALQASDIDLIIAQTTGGHIIMPGIAAHVHHAIGMRDDAPAWNVQQCCGSWVDACYLAWNMIKAGGYRRILVLAATAWETGGADVDLTSPAAPFCGDGAAAAVVSDQNLRGEFLSYANRTYGELYPHLVTTAAPPAIPQLAEQVRQKPHFAHMVVGSGFADYIAGKGKRLPVELLPELMHKAGLQIEDLDFIIPHQVQKFFNDLWIDESRAIGVAPGKWHDTWDKYGNIGGVDVPISFVEFIGDGQISAGMRIALFSPGAAGHSPTILVDWLN